MGTLGNVTTRSGSYTEAFHNLSMPETLLQNLDMPISPFTLNADDTQHVGDVSSAATMHQFITQGESLPVRVYDSGSNILNAYYLFIHPFLPLLPPPGAEEQVDSPAQFALSTASLSTFRGDHLPSYSDSPLFMALAAILALIPLSEEHQGITTHSAALIRRSVAHMYAEKAMYFVDEDLGRPISMPIGSVSDLVNWPRPRDSIHPHTPVQLESLLALLILSQYEYCQRGNLCKMRARANQAMTQAMDMGLHRIEDDHEFLEAKRRAWWMTVSCYWN
ncbi:hypothetical protein BDV59DRAFT_167240 [Aspergillus ambiguus]|uniref:uncharacterized protein n=1 Tax=Aspergillus ambiguus TaxID=176160 RepID=UPI003CCDDB92